jgi:hypothetical protein
MREILDAALLRELGSRPGARSAATTFAAVCDRRSLPCTRRARAWDSGTAAAAPCRSRAAGVSTSPGAWCAKCSSMRSRTSSSTRSWASPTRPRMARLSRICAGSMASIRRRAACPRRRRRGQSRAAPDRAPAGPGREPQSARGRGGDEHGATADAQAQHRSDGDPGEPRDSPSGTWAGRAAASRRPSMCWRGFWRATSSSR